ncbi:hypothetical protein GCM10016272_15230 [Psychrobacter glaciei]|uniref:Uncharacterized protein n=1 Tax=Psychrobacter glaciei TaxID=619771 RepID=A0ABQ3GSF0_9GAMM|nr:hypothetical protein GCM10016272_15230 [Psychrobacter glaciei]
MLAPKVASKRKGTPPSIINVMSDHLIFLISFKLDNTHGVNKSRGTLNRINMTSAMLNDDAPTARTVNAKPDQINNTIIIAT